MSSTDGKNLNDYIGAAVREELRIQVRVAAAKQDITSSEFIRQAVQEKLDRFNE